MSGAVNFDRSTHSATVVTIDGNHSDQSGFLERVSRALRFSFSSNVVTPLIGVTGSPSPVLTCYTNKDDEYLIQWEGLSSSDQYRLFAPITVVNAQGTTNCSLQAPMFFSRFHDSQVYQKCGFWTQEGGKQDFYAECGGYQRLSFVKLKSSHHKVLIDKQKVGTRSCEIELLIPSQKGAKKFVKIDLPKQNQVTVSVDGQLIFSTADGFITATHTGENDTQVTTNLTQTQTLSFEKEIAISGSWSLVRRESTVFFGRTKDNDQWGVLINISNPDLIKWQFGDFDRKGQWVLTRIRGEVVQKPTDFEVNLFAQANSVNYLNGKIGCTIEGKTLDATCLDTTSDFKTALVSDREQSALRQALAGHIQMDISSLSNGELSPLVAPRLKSQRCCYAICNTRRMRVVSAVCVLQTLIIVGLTCALVYFIVYPQPSTHNYISSRPVGNIVVTPHNGVAVFDGRFLAPGESDGNISSTDVVVRLTGDRCHAWSYHNNCESLVDNTYRT